MRYAIRFDARFRSRSDFLSVLRRGRVFSVRLVVAVFALLGLASVATARPDTGFWTAVEIEGEVVVMRRSGETPSAVQRGDTVPPRSFVQVRPGGRAVFRSGDDTETIPAGQSRLLRSTDAPGSALPTPTPPTREHPGSPAAATPSDRIAPPAFPSAGAAQAHYRDQLARMLERSGRELDKLEATRPSPTAAAGTRSLTPGVSRTTLPAAEIEEARDILHGHRLPASPRTESEDVDPASAPLRQTERTRSVEGAHLRAIPPAASARSTASTAHHKDSPAAVGGRLEIAWPPDAAILVVAPTTVRLQWTPPAVLPRSLLLETDGVSLLRVPLGARSREILLPELAVLAEPGRVYTLTVGWTDPAGVARKTTTEFEILSPRHRDRMRHDLFYLYEALGPLWNEREGLMLRAAVFSEFNCQAEAAELLLRYVMAAPEDREAHLLLHEMLRAVQQPERAHAALALASGMQ